MSQFGATKDPRRIRPILEKIARYWYQHPELRIGQILTNASPQTTADGGEIDLYYLDDAALEAGLDKMLLGAMDSGAEKNKP